VAQPQAALARQMDAEQKQRKHAPNTVNAWETSLNVFPTLANVSASGPAVYTTASVLS
jgi:hypothetical protein